MTNYLIAYVLISILVLPFALALGRAAARADRMSEEAVSSKVKEALESELFGAAE